MTEDSLLRLIARLPGADSDSLRAERVRARCHAALARQRRQQEELRSARASGLWPLAAALGGVYITEMIRQTLLFYGIL
jgi:hypothetical protein